MLPVCAVISKMASAECLDRERQTMIEVNRLNERKTMRKGSSKLSPNESDNRTTPLKQIPKAYGFNSAKEESGTGTLSSNTSWSDSKSLYTATRDVGKWESKVRPQSPQIVKLDDIPSPDSSSVNSDCHAALDTVRGTGSRSLYERPHQSGRKYSKLSLSFRRNHDHDIVFMEAEPKFKGREGSCEDIFHSDSDAASTASIASTELLLFTEASNECQVEDRDVLSKIKKIKEILFGFKENTKPYAASFTRRLARQKGNGEVTDDENNKQYYKDVGILCRILPKEDESQHSAQIKSDKDKTSTNPALNIKHILLSFALGVILFGAFKKYAGDIPSMYCHEDDIQEIVFGVILRWVSTLLGCVSDPAALSYVTSSLAGV